MPTAVLSARGSWRAKTRTEEPQVPSGLPDKPAMSEAAATEWDRITTILIGLGIITPIDGDALQIYCETFVTWKEAQAKVRELGSVIKAPSGYPIQNPYLSIANAAGAFCQKMLEQFGMTPASRSRVHKAPSPADRHQPGIPNIGLPRLRIAEFEDDKAG